MIDQLLTDQQAHEIVEIIKIQCMHFQSFMKKGDSIFYGPYTQMRQKYSATSAVISGFAPGRFQIEGITSRNLYYGLHNGLVQPELSCENGIFHIYSSSNKDARDVFSRGGISPTAPASEAAQTVRIAAGYPDAAPRDNACRRPPAAGNRHRRQTMPGRDDRADA